MPLTSTSPHKKAQPNPPATTQVTFSSPSSQQPSQGAFRQDVTTADFKRLSGGCTQLHLSASSGLHFNAARWEEYLNLKDRNNAETKTLAAVLYAGVHSNVEAELSALLLAQDVCIFIGLNKASQRTIVLPEVL